MTRPRRPRRARGRTRTRHAALARPDAFASGEAGSTATLRTNGIRPATIAGPGLVSTREFDGIDQEDAGGVIEPPNAWVAVNATHIVQSTEGLVRVSSRAGQELATIATWALFGVPAGYTDAQPRITWDAYHGRWVGVLMYFDSGTFADTNLVVAVSDGVNPLGSWSLYSFSYANDLPDSPAIASSSDKIVVTANEFPDGMSYAGSSILSIPWSAVLEGTVNAAGYVRATSAWNLRPGRITGTAADVWAVYENLETGNLTLVRVTGNGLAPGYPIADLGIANGSGLSIDPRQPGDADGIVSADDGRIPDAVWRANKLWFARTVQHSFDGINDDLVVEMIGVTTSSSAAPVVYLDELWGGYETDVFSPGVGFAGSGTVFITATLSNSSVAPRAIALAYHPTNGFNGWIAIATSDASYDGNRWGGYAGVATDPSGTDAVWQTRQTADSTGGWRTHVSRLVLDTTPPTATAPKQELVKGTTLGTTVPVKVSWTGSDAGSGVARYRLEQNDHGAGFDLAVTTTGTTYVNLHTWKPAGSTANRSWQYRVTPEDDGANIGNPATGSTLTPTNYQQTHSSFTYSTGWSSSSNAKYSGGSVKYSSKAGASASFRTSGRSFGFVTTRGSTRGKVKIYVDGASKGTFTLTSSSSKYRNIAYAITFTTTGTHTIKLVVVSGRVDVDSFIVLK